MKIKLMCIVCVSCFTLLPSLGYSACTVKSRTKLPDACSHLHVMRDDKTNVGYVTEECTTCRPKRCKYNNVKREVIQGNMEQWKYEYCEAKCKPETKCEGNYVNTDDTTTYHKEFNSCV